MKKFLFGDKPSSFDATLFSTLSGIVEIWIELPLKRYALTKGSIMNYMDLINELYWAD
jgi:hypothetical protein